MYNNYINVSKYEFFWREFVLRLYLLKRMINNNLLQYKHLYSFHYYYNKMIDKKEQLVPSKDLAEFYAIKISTHLKMVEGYYDELANNKYLLIRVRHELGQIYKQIHYRLIKHELTELAIKYKNIDDKLSRLKPFEWDVQRDSEGEREKKLKKGKDYSQYSKLLQELEMIIWECIGELGLTGKVDIQTRRLR